MFQQHTVEHLSRVINPEKGSAFRNLGNSSTLDAPSIPKLKPAGHVRHHFQRGIDHDVPCTKRTEKLTNGAGLKPQTPKIIFESP